MKVSELFPSKYIKAADLNGKSYTFKIATMRLEEMRDQNDKTVKKAVLYFEGPRKGLILNRTIADTIVDISGHEEIDLWPGCEVTLYPTSVQAFGKTHQVVRVRRPDVQQPAGGGNAPDSLMADEDELAHSEVEE